MASPRRPPGWRERGRRCCHPPEWGGREAMAWSAMIEGGRTSNLAPAADPSSLAAGGKAGEVVAEWGYPDMCGRCMWAEAESYEEISKREYMRALESGIT